MTRIDKDLKKAKELLLAGQLVAIPTETVYGLAANALDEKTVLNIFKVKNRPTFDPLIVHTHSLASLRDFVTEIPPQSTTPSRKIDARCFDFAIAQKSNIPDLVTSGLPNVAIRIPKHPLTLQLLQSLPFPLAAPSANPFGYISPTTAQHVADQLGEKIPYILDGGTCDIGLESTIVGFEGNEAIVYRKGGVSIEAIEAIIGKVQIQAHLSSNPQAPGMLKSHYAPKTPFYLGNIDELLANYLSQNSQNQAIKIGLLNFKELKNYGHFKHSFTQEVLSNNADFSEAAHNLFAAMRRLDDLQLDVIFAELLPEQDLGRAINDRLRRAAV